MYDEGDTLLFALSARREIRWPVFRRTLDSVHRRQPEHDDVDGSPARYVRNRVLRLFVSLGHFDVCFTDGTGTVFVAPPVLAGLPSAGLPRAVLCGARSPETGPALRRACSGTTSALNVRITSQKSVFTYAPARVEVEGESHEALQRAAGALGVEYTFTPPTWTLAKLSGSLDEYLRSLEWSPEPELNWEREDFHPELAKFTSSPLRFGEMRLSRYQDPVRLRWIHRLYASGLGADVDVDWGRYAVLQAAGQHVLAYDGRTGEVAVPRGTPLPPLLAKTLCLCSGYAPRFVPHGRAVGSKLERSGFDAYTNVPPDVLAVVTSKLGQVVRRTRFVPEGSGG